MIITRIVAVTITGIVAGDNSRYSSGDYSRIVAGDNNRYGSDDYSRIVAVTTTA